MRRRRVETAESHAPLRLVRYRPRDWRDQPAAFWAARDAYREAGGALPPMTEPGPDVPLRGLADL